MQFLLLVTVLDEGNFFVVQAQQTLIFDKSK